MSLQKIVQQLDNKQFALLTKNFKLTKAEKYNFLLSSYRQDEIVDEKAILASMELSPPAFYTLKSRLTDKVQEFLYENIVDTRIQLLQNVANIEHIVYKTPRETGIGLLKKLEGELLKFDMPNELIIVYKALKKLHLYSPKYYEYSQLYNRYVAFKLGQDRAEELFSSFCKTLGEYYLNRDTSLLEILVLYKKEMNNVCDLYDSHHLHVYKNILNIHFALFSPVNKEMEEDATIEKMLKDTLTIIESHPDHRTYVHFGVILDFLNFEYYLQLKLYKDASVFYERLADNVQGLLYYNHSSFVFHFLISKIEYTITCLDEKLLQLDFELYEVNPDDKSGYVIYKYYKACSQYYSGLYDEAIRTLTKLSNEINTIENPFLEIEIKMFLSLLHIIEGTKNQAESSLRSAMRKITNEKNDEVYHLPLAFIKILKIALSPKSKNRYKKLIEMYQHFNAINTGPYKILTFLRLNDSVLKKMLGVRRLGDSSDIKQVKS